MRDARQEGLGDRVPRVIAGVALGIVCMYVASRYRLSIDAMLIPRLVAGCVLAVLAHEAGHAVAAMSQRLRISRFAVWPIRIYRDLSSWRVGWLPLHGAGGFISITLAGTEHTRRRQFVVVAAGPFASLLLAAGCWIAIRAGYAQPKWVVDQLLIIGLWSLLCAAGGLVPSRSGTMTSDGDQLWMLMRGGDEG